jgi:hypothetical protein
MADKHTDKLFSDTLFCNCKKETGTGNFIYPVICFYFADTGMVPDMR